MNTKRNAVRVTVSDPETGEELESKVITDNYMVVCAGRRYVHYTQQMGQTHMVCIKHDTTPHAGGTDA